MTAQKSANMKKNKRRHGAQPRMKSVFKGGWGYAPTSNGEVSAEAETSPFGLFV